MRTGILFAGVVVATLAASCSLDREGTGELVASTAGTGGTQSIGDAAAGSGGADASESSGGTGGSTPTGGTGGSTPTGGTGGGVPTGGTGGAAGGASAGAAGSVIEAECGNGIVEPPEACDDGFTDDCGSCNATCAGPGTGSVCGDKVVCPETETCDDGFADDCGTCNATCTGPGTGSVCGDGHVCPETEACDDGEKNDCGACNATCTAPGNGQPCVTQGACADGSNEQVFQNGMVGCAGQVTRANRATLCAPGSVVCSSSKWVANRGGAAPSNHYWVEDALPYYYGYNGNCSASAIASGSYGTCNAATPMRVCSTSNWSYSNDAYRDPLGNFCNWGRCGLNSYTNNYFGGCNGNTTAGALCCLP